MKRRNKVYINTKKKRQNNKEKMESYLWQIDKKRRITTITKKIGQVRGKFFTVHMRTCTCVSGQCLIVGGWWWHLMQLNKHQD